jgi:hypothetical protein
VWQYFAFGTEGNFFCISFKQIVISLWLTTFLILPSSFATSYVVGFLSRVTFQGSSHGLKYFFVIVPAASDTTWPEKVGLFAVSTYEIPVFPYFFVPLPSP